MLPRYSFISPQADIYAPSADTFCQACDNFRQIFGVGGMVRFIGAGFLETLKSYHDSSDKASRPSLLIRYRNDRNVIPRSRAALCLEPWAMSSALRI